MSNDALTTQQRAALLLLLAVTAQVGNNDLKDRFGVTLTGKDKARLNDLKLVSSGKVAGFGNQIFHELEEKGWARARTELTGDLPTGRWGRAVALGFAAQLDRYLARTDLRLFDLFRAPSTDVSDVEPPADGAEEAPAEEAPAEEAPADVAERIRGTYWRLTDGPNGWVLLSALRQQLGDVPRADVDTALIALNSAPDVTLVPEMNKKSLSKPEKAAAVVIGNQKKHLIAIEGA
ncbi:hypothetical protein [Cryptosporangium minutisporangium]|uniref:Uncharacterized protein n=1 Tax=Cryptosporangium minutisporangium TaxID=113569 RepID=A0ABP6T8D2_9ACTN